MNYERILRMVRSHSALFGDLGAAKEAQADRIRDRCKAKLKPKWDERSHEQRRKASDRKMQAWT